MARRPPASWSATRSRRAGSVIEDKLIATSKTSTLQKELAQVAEQGYEAVGMTVGSTAMGGSELVVITRRLAR